MKQLSVFLLMLVLTAKARHHEMEYVFKVNEEEAVAMMWGKHFIVAAGLCTLTCSLVLSKTHSPTTPIIPSLGRPNAAGRNRELTILQGESLRIYLFCDQEHSNTEKVWCKEDLMKPCLPRTNPVIFSEPEWKVLTTASNEKVRLGDSRKSCASVHMTTVEVEDSGIYWFGLLHGRKIDYLSPVKMVVHKGLSVPHATVLSPTFRTPSFESPSKTEWRPVEVTVVQGESLSIVGFCGQQRLKTETVWCKGELLKECGLKAHGQFLGPGWKYLTTEPNQRIIKRDSTDGCISLFMSDLQLKDSGIYWFGFLDGQNIISFKKITVIVQEEQKNNGNMTVAKENRPSIYHVVLVVGSTMAGILVITFITILLVMMFTKSNLRAAEVRDGENLNTRRTTLQMQESNFVNSPLETETNAVYAILKKPKSRAEEVTYVNTMFPLRSVAVSPPNNSVSVQSSLEPGEYANISFGSRNPHDRE